MIPIRTGRDEETVSEPGLEETILGGLVDVDVAGQDDLNVAWVHQEDQQLRSEPDLNDLIVLEGLPVQATKYGCNRGAGVRDRKLRKHMRSKLAARREIHSSTYPIRVIGNTKDTQKVCGIIVKLTNRNPISRL